MSENPQHVVPQVSDDPFENLCAFARTHIPDADIAYVMESIHVIREDALANRPADIGCAALLAGLPTGTREEARALIDDIKVFLTQRRNNMLCNERIRDFDETDIERLFRDVCLNPLPPLDRDLAKTAAQAIVFVSPQASLLRLVTETMDDARTRLANAPHDSPAWRDALLTLGRLLTFLRWVPHDWAEEVVINTLKGVSLPKHVDRLRLWISSLRVFFCRPSIQNRSTAEILDRLQKDFGDTVPMELRSLFWALLIKGGMESARLLLDRLREDPTAWQTEYFLNALSMIDKAGCADWLLEHEEATLAKLGAHTFLSLLAASGETGARSSACMMRLWQKADAPTRRAVVDTILDLHFGELARVLVETLPGEPEWDIRLRMTESVAAVGDLQALRALAASVRKDRSAIRYYTIHLIHGRLLDSPSLLLQQDNFILLHDIQQARIDVYATYMLLIAYRDALNGVRNAVRVARDNGLATSMRIGPRLTLHSPAVAGSTGSGDSWGEILKQAAHGAEIYRARVDRFAEAAAVLRDADVFAGCVQRNVLGAITARWMRADLLDETDLLLPEGIPSGRESETLERLLRKAKASIAFVQEYLLLQEWFVREIPFVLHEQMLDTIETIRAGQVMELVSVDLADKDARCRVRLAFRAFVECSKQGIYLTDVLYHHLATLSPDQWPEVIRGDFTRRRIMVADGSLKFHPSEALSRHLQFTTFAHDYRYGKESLAQPSLTYVWLRYLRLTERITCVLKAGPWPKLPPHPDVPLLIGPLTDRVYGTHEKEATVMRDLIFAIHDRSKREDFEMRVIPNLTYGLFCVAPVMDEIVRRGIHVSFAGVSSRFCDDENISALYLPDSAVFPLKRYVFSNASNYGTLNNDRLLIVVEGTMEPLDRHDLGRVRLPKAYRGFVNHLAVVNYIRARYGYRMADPEREVASALSLPLRFVKNLARTRNFRHLVDRLLLCFDADALDRSHATSGTGRTYYSFSQWNPDGMAARIGPIGYEKREVECATVKDLAAPALLFISMNSIFNESGVAAFFDNNPEVEHPRMYIGPTGAKIDIGWPGEYLGVEAGRNVHS